MMAESSRKALSVPTLRRELLEMQYAVRGPILDKAAEIERKLKTSPEDFNYTEVIPGNIGNPQAVGQPCINYYRHLVSAVLNGDGFILERNPKTGEPTKVVDLPFAADVLARAARLRNTLRTGGAYTASKGDLTVREEVAEGFGIRDGFPASPDSIFMTDGASTGVKLALELALGSSSDGVILPVPEYPLYSACIKRFQGHCLRVYLDEEQGWALRAEDVRPVITEARKNGITPRALVVVNPGNPTGSLLKREEMVKLIKLCEEETLLLIADEVYQENIWGENCEFVSFRRVMKELNSSVELVSLHSISKGFYGECGFRGGIMQIENFDPKVVSVLLKMVSVSLCSNTIGQIVAAAIMKPPQDGEPSYPLYCYERDQILGSLRRKTALANEAFARSPGIKSQPAVAALYAYPQIEIPAQAILKAQELGVEPDFLWCSEFLERYGVITVPGSGFGQKPGTYHFRVTILPPEAQFKKLVEGIVAFQQDFRNRYGDKVHTSPSLRLVKNGRPETASDDDVRTSASGESPVAAR